MLKGNVRTPEQALVYMTDCTLATVCDMAMKKSRPVGEYARQKMIAQIGIDWIKYFSVDPYSRPKDVLCNHDGSVEKYAGQYDIMKEAE